MKKLVIISFTILTMLCPFYVAGSDFEDQSTPIEQEDIRTIDQINEATSFEDESMPIENEDIKSIDQINGDTSFENESTPIEQEDIKTIEQINK